MKFLIFTNLASFLFISSTIEANDGNEKISIRQLKSPKAPKSSKTKHQIDIEQEEGIRRMKDLNMSPLLLTNNNKCPEGYDPAPTENGLNGDLNQGAGGRDIFLCINLFSKSPLHNLKLQESSICGSGYTLVPAYGGLNGDLNQRAGGKDIFLCYSTDITSGRKINAIELKRFGPIKEQQVSIIPPLNGDLNQGAGGKDIHLKIDREGAKLTHPIIISHSKSECPDGYTTALYSRGLNGDLNQGAGGKDIFLCTNLNDNALHALKLVQSYGNCEDDWERAPTMGSLNGDLNQSAGGKDIFLCYSTRPYHGKQILNIYLNQEKPTKRWMEPIMTGDGLNGDLNQGAGGKDIYFELFKSSDSSFPDEESFSSALTTYDYEADGYPEPGYMPANVCIFGCTAVAPCWHVQQLVTFADENYLFTFFTMSQPRNGKAYLLKAPLTKYDSAALPAVTSVGEVIWYKETTGFNHPGDLVISDRFILTANQNWDPMADQGFGEKLGCTIPGVCNCESNLASNRQALTIWDFNTSSHTEYTIDKHDFDQILLRGDQMDSSDSDDLWGGKVDGNLIINFENKWLRHKTGQFIGDVAGWERIKDTNVIGQNPPCDGEVVGSNKLFTTIDGKSFLASFEVNNDCYSLRPVTYDDSTKKLEFLSCEGTKKVCTRGGQLVHHARDRQRAFQTITQGPNGQVFLTSINLYGTETQVVATHPISSN